MPDFDIDFCQERRGEVIEYVREKYGVDRVAQIITFGTLQARAVLRDVGRVLQLPFGQVDKLAKLVPFNPANPPTLADALEMEPKLEEAIEEEEEVANLFETAQQLEGLYRNASTHAAGIVIGDRPLVELVGALPRSAVRHAGHPVQHEVGRGRGPREVRLPRPQDAHGDRPRDQAASRNEGRRDRSPDACRSTTRRPTRCSSSGDVVGVFQVESQGMRRALVDMVPDRFEDLIVLVALYRPGPMANIPTYCNRKKGFEEIDYFTDALTPWLKPILEPTFGIITYQEQVMQIARELAGYSFGEADLLRRAMGKKIRAEMDKQRARFMEGAIERGISEAGRRHDVRGLRQVRRLRLQQVPLRALRAADLPDGLAEGEPSGRVPRRLDEPRLRQHRQARRVLPGSAPHGRRGAPARHQQVRAPTSPSRTAPCAMRLAPSRASASRRCCRSRHARKDGAVHATCRISPSVSMRGW